MCRAHTRDRISNKMLKGKHIILGITGSIAAYKAAYIIRALVKKGAEVQVVITPAGKEFITPLTLSTLSSHPVISEFFSNRDGTWNSHVDLGLWADAMLVAPATASTIGKMANGIADNMLVTTYLSCKAPVFIAPAMDLDMFAHPSTQQNLERLRSFGNRFTASVEGFFERRSHILISSGATVSGIIGIGVGLQPAGEHEYRGFDASIAWNDRRKDFSYGVYANASYLDSEVIADGQEYQPYDYLYHRGNRVGQSYGLEVVGIFQSQMEINESPVQTFSTVRPGDFKYRDQNGDNRIDDLDMVRMHGSSVPRFYFGFGFHVGYKGIELSADFQGMTGRTVNLLNCPLYKPLIGNGNISQTLLDHEIPWSAERASEATMPRLTTLSNANNYRNNSYWYRDGSFIKLRNLTVAYTLPKRILRFADMKIYLQGTNLFSLDNLKTVDPEQLGAAYPSVRSYWAGVKFNF